MQAAEKAIANPLLDEISLKGAKGVLINITAGPDLTLFELDEAANRIRAEVDPDANIMVGSTLDPEMAGMMRVSVVATGIDAVAKSEAMPLPRRAAEPVAAPAARLRSPHGRRPAAAGDRFAPEPLAEPARAPSFADHHVAEVEREELFAEPEAAAGAAAGLAAAHRALRPAEVRGRASAAPCRRAFARCPAAAAGGGAERAQGAADGAADRAAAARDRAAQPADHQQPDPQDDRPGRARAGRAAAGTRRRAGAARQPAGASRTTRIPNANASTFPPSSDGRPTDGGAPPRTSQPPPKAPGIPPPGAFFIARNPAVPGRLPGRLLFSPRRLAVGTNVAIGHKP